jgi:hypothetical protein
MIIWLLSVKVQVPGTIRSYNDLIKKSGWVSSCSESWAPANQPPTFGELFIQFGHTFESIFFLEGHLAWPLHTVNYELGQFFFFFF